MKILYIVNMYIHIYNTYMRSDIFDACVAAIGSINGGVSTYEGIGSPYTYQTTIAQTSRGAKFFGEINDFPYACIWVDSESRFHTGADQRYLIMYFTVRALFEGSPTGLPAVDEAENFLEDLDHVCKNFRKWLGVNANGVDTSGTEILEVRILNIATDSGVLEPRSVAECVFEVIYLNTP